MRAGEKDGIEPGECLARQQTVPHRQFLPPRLEGVRLERSVLLRRPPFWSYDSEERQASYYHRVDRYIE